MKKTFFALGMVLFAAVGFLATVKLNRQEQSLYDQNPAPYDSPKIASKPTNFFPAISKPKEATPSIAHSTGAASDNPLLAQLFHRSIEPLSLEIIQSLKTSDAPALMAYYREHTNLLDRKLVSSALGQIGGDEVADLLICTLTKEYAGYTVNESKDEENEEFVMVGFVYTLGFLAQRSDKAWRFIQEGIDPWFWQRNITWKSSDTPDTYGILAGTCIKAVAISGRVEAERILNALKDQPLTNDPAPDPTDRSLDGALMDAAFYHSIIKTEGIEGLKRYYFGPEGRSDTWSDDDRWGRWRASEDGKKWVHPRSLSLESWRL